MSLWGKDLAVILKDIQTLPLATHPCVQISGKTETNDTEGMNFLDICKQAFLQDSSKKVIRIVQSIYIS